MGGRIEGPAETSAIDPTHRIAVLPFSYRGSEEHAYLGEGMVDLLSYSLDGVGEVQTVTPRAVFGVLRQYEQDSADPDLGATVARRVHALLNDEARRDQAGSQSPPRLDFVPSDSQAISLSMEKLRPVVR